MKKVSLLVIFALLSFGLFAQTQGQTANKPAAEQPSDDLTALQTANALARYGYKAQSASALIGAAEILSQVPTQPLGVDPTRDGTGSTDVATPEFSAAKLLEDGIKLAGKDKTLLAWAKEVDKALKSKTRGAIGGPKWAVDVIASRATHYYDISFQGNLLAEVGIFGAGTSDLDFYIYDSNGRLVISDESRYDGVIFSFVPTRPGVFRIVILNRGPNANRYELITN